MQDRHNARLMNTRSTGSGRRENYRHIVLPRMRNTMMLNGKQTQEEMIKSVDKEFLLSALEVDKLILPLENLYLIVQKHTR